MSEPSSNLGRITGSTEMLTYLLVWGLGSAHYPEFGGSNPPVSIGEHGMGSTEMSIFLSWSKGSDIVLD